MIDPSKTELDSQSPPTGTPRPARYIMIGGFLGAGKTTAISRLATHLVSQGRRVGLITNDLGSELVDTTTLRAKGFSTEEILGGCFCCRFNSLTEAAGRLTASTQPDVFIAEPVGSCTDLVATVSYPLRRMYGADFSVAPLSVLVDPIRAARVFGLEEGTKFSEKVAYIYRKQLEEADLIVINKSELISTERMSRLKQALREQFPRTDLIEISARLNKGLDAWIEFLEGSVQGSGKAMEVDYEVYAEGEALMGWLNATVQTASRKGFDGNHFLKLLATEIQCVLSGNRAEIAHLKMTLSPEFGLGELGVINLVRNDWVPELASEISEPVESGQLIINLRAEAAPELLHEAVTQALRLAGEMVPHLFVRLEHLEHFRPRKPQPTHRFTSPT